MQSTRMDAACCCCGCFVNGSFIQESRGAMDVVVVPALASGPGRVCMALMQALDRGKRDTDTQTHRHPATSHYPTIHSLSTRYPSTPDGPGHPDCQLYPSPCRLHTFPLHLTNIVATLVATLPLPPTTVAHCRRQVSHRLHFHAITRNPL